MSADAFVLAFSSNLEGNLEPCGCTADPLGGLARFAQVFEDIRSISKNRMTFLDTGNILFDAPTRHAADLCQDNARIELLLSTLSKLGLKTTVLGGQDNARGETYRLNWLKKYNIENLSQNTSPTLKLIPTSHYNIAILALNDHENISPTSLKKEVDNLLSSVKNKNIKLVVAISQIKTEKIKTLSMGLNNVDIILQGATTATSIPAPVKIEGGPWLFEGGRQGQYFTSIILENISQRAKEALPLDTRSFENNERKELLKKRIQGLRAQLENSAQKDFLQQRLQQATSEFASLENKTLSKNEKPIISFNTIALNRQIDNLKTVKDQLIKYDTSLPALAKKCEQTIECPKGSPDGAKFVGAENCRICHQQAYDVWQKAQFTMEGLSEDGQKFKRAVGHSKAWQTLVDAHKDQDRSCIGCHSIGFMQPGGYCKTSEVDFRKNVQCESCHGAGSLHAKSGEKKYIKLPNEETCRSCHHEPHIQSFESFNYEERLMKILGPGHGEKLFNTLKAKSL